MRDLPMTSSFHFTKPYFWSSSLRSEEDAVDCVAGAGVEAVVATGPDGDFSAKPWTTCSSVLRRAFSAWISRKASSRVLGSAAFWAKVGRVHRNKRLTTNEIIFMKNFTVF